MIKEIMMKNWKHIALSAVAVAAMTGCGDTTISYGDSTVTIGDTIVNGDTNGDTNTTTYPTAPATRVEISGEISENMTLTSDTAWILNGYTYVDNNATLTIQPGTFIAGKNSDSYLLIDKGAKIVANGTAEQPIIFTSMEGLDGLDDTVGKWGGVTLIGNANMTDTTLTYEVKVNGTYTAGTGMANDSSGSLKHVWILNSATETGNSEETNGLSMVGVGAGTVIEDIKVDYSNDDCIEIWGGRVNLKNVTVSHCTDDHVDVDSGYQGMIENLLVTATMGYSGIEMSGVGTVLTVDGFTINHKSYAAGADAFEGAVYFKNAGVGGKFYNGTINYTNPDGAVFYSAKDANLTEIDFGKVTINTSAGQEYLNKTSNDLDSGDEIWQIFVDGIGGSIGNVLNYY